MTRTPVADAILAIDVGNTRVGLALSDADGLRAVQRVDARDDDALRAALESAWTAAANARRRVVVIGSVWPERARTLSEMVRALLGVVAMHVRDDLPLPMPLDLDNAEQVGVDRVCAAAAAYDRIRGACAVASFGTAITIDCVSARGVFLGGAILPGMQMSLDALHAGAAQLPAHALAAPHGVFGRNTRDAMCNGVVYGAVGALREIVERFATELREWPPLVITGGNADLVRELADYVDGVAPDLCLMGIALTYRRATERREEGASGTGPAGL
ncbi:MAG: type III pantothenate kinase [Phycisphaerae bacterium]